MLRLFVRPMVMLGLAGYVLAAQALVVTSADQMVNLTPYAQVLLDPTRYVFEPLPPGTTELSLGFTSAA
jgi:hypothetical protein